MAAHGYRAVIGEIAAQQRANGAGNAKNTAEKAGEFAALPRRVQVRDDGEGGCKKRAAAQSLHRPEYDELHHAAAQQRQVAKLAGKPGEPRAEQKQPYSSKQYRLAA